MAGGWVGAEVRERWQAVCTGERKDEETRRGMYIREYR